MFKIGEQKNSVQEVLEILGGLVVITRHGVPKQSLKVIVRLLREACSERHEILRSFCSLRMTRSEGLVMTE